MHNYNYFYQNTGCPWVVQACSWVSTQILGCPFGHVDGWLPNILYPVSFLVLTLYIYIQDPVRLLVFDQYILYPVCFLVSDQYILYPVRLELETKLQELDRRKIDEESQRHADREKLEERLQQAADHRQDAEKELLVLKYVLSTDNSKVHTDNNSKVCTDNSKVRTDDNSKV